MFITIGKQDWRYFTVAGDDPNEQTNEKRNFEGCVAAGYIRDYFTGRQNKKTTENQRWRLTVI